VPPDKGRIRVECDVTRAEAIRDESCHAELAARMSNRLPLFGRRVFWHLEVPTSVTAGVNGGAAVACRDTTRRTNDPPSATGQLSV
jgi:hypothetical protein